MSTRRLRIASILGQWSQYCLYLLRLTVGKAQSIAERAEKHRRAQRVGMWPGGNHCALARVLFDRKRPSSIGQIDWPAAVGSERGRAQRAIRGSSRCSRGPKTFFLLRGSSILLEFSYLFCGVSLVSLVSLLCFSLWVWEGSD